MPDASALEPAKKMFFLVGRGRSGTTLLVQLLDAHPLIAMAPEALFVVSLFRRYRHAAWTDETVRRFCRDLRHEDRLRRWRFDPDALERALLAGPRAGYPEMCAAVYAAAAAGRGRLDVRRLGDKNPHHALFLPTLMEIFPQARFIHLVRDHRDTILSYQNVPFDASSAPVLAIRWRLYNEAVLAAAARAPERFLRVRFEDLVGEPEMSLRAMCDFLGVEWTPSLLADRQIPYWGLMEWHRKLADPVDARQAGKWRTTMAPRDVDVADAICQPLAAHLGYPPHSPRAATLRLRERVELMAGGYMTWAERAIMRVPLGLRAALIRGYRGRADNPIA